MDPHLTATALVTQLLAWWSAPDGLGDVGKLVAAGIWAFLAYQLVGQRLRDVGGRLLVSSAAAMLALRYDAGLLAGGIALLGMGLLWLGRYVSQRRGVRQGDGEVEHLPSDAPGQPGRGEAGRPQTAQERQVA